MLEVSTAESPARLSFGLESERRASARKEDIIGSLASIRCQTKGEMAAEDGRFDWCEQRFSTIRPVAECTCQRRSIVIGWSHSSSLTQPFPLGCLRPLSLSPLFMSHSVSLGDGYRPKEPQMVDIECDMINNFQISREGSFASLRAAM